MKQLFPKTSDTPRYRVVIKPLKYWNARLQKSVHLFGRHLFWRTIYKSWHQFECEIRANRLAESGAKYVVSEVM